MKIVIVGAGIGGLTAALCLAKDGHQVVVLEQAEKFSEIGAGLQCGANAVRVLNYLGLTQACEAVAVQPEAIEFRDYLRGDSLYSIELGQTYQQRFGAPYYHIHRADLHKVLLSAAQQHEQIQLLTRHELQRIENRGDRVAAITTTGVEHVGELLIGCDGIKSVVRDRHIQFAKPRYTGNTAWRALIPVERLPANFMPTVVSNFVGPKKHMVMYYVRNRRYLNLVGVVENAKATDTSWTSTAPWSELRDDYSGWHPMVTDAIAALQGETCYRWALYDQAPLAQWHRERVVLLGDAAHATLPFMASGAALAIEDARILQRCLRVARPLEERLRIYQKNRIARTTRVQNTSRKFGTLYHIPNRFLLKTAFKSLRLLGGKKEDFLPEYDANTVPINTSPT